MSKFDFGDIEKAMMKAIEDQIKDKYRGLAASIIDPETGKTPIVRFVKTGEGTFSVLIEASNEYKRLLNDRLIAEDLQPLILEDKEDLLVYLAHTSKDKPVVKELAKKLLSDGIDVWYDEWEIRGGDSLKRKMEDGLERCTHFVVFLTPESIDKPWVNEEIDAAFIRKVDKHCKFIPIRSNLNVEDLSPFLRSQLVRAYSPENIDTYTSFRDDILGVSIKPSKAPTPEYVKAVPKDLEDWSPSAVAVAKAFVEGSKHALIFDPQLTMEDLQSLTMLSEDSIKDGLMDLSNRGLLRETVRTINGIWSPEKTLFTEFDSHLMDWNTKEDAMCVAVTAVNQEKDIINLQQLHELTNIPPRRLNVAVTYLEQADLVRPLEAIGTSPYGCMSFRFDHPLKRYVREHC